MCSVVLKILFLGGLLAGTALTVCALVLPDWIYLGNRHVGLFTKCDYSYDDVKISGDTCSSVWKSQHQLVVAAACCLLVAAGISSLAFIWWLIACIGCCCQSALTPPLPIFAVLMCLLDSAAVILYHVYKVNHVDTTTGQQLEEAAQNVFNKLGIDQSVATITFHYGLSFYFAIGAVGAFLLDAVIGIGLVIFTRKAHRYSSI